MNQQVPNEEIGRTMYRISCMIRGVVIGNFATIEALMDDFIRRLTFDNKRAYDELMPLIRAGTMPMETKKALIKFCIKKYESMFDEKLPVLKTHLNKIIDERNICAHWLLEQTAAGRKLFKEKNKITFFTGKKGKTERRYFTINSATELERTIAKILIELAVAQNNLDNIEGS